MLTIQNGGSTSSYLKESKLLIVTPSDSATAVVVVSVNGSVVANQSVSVATTFGPYSKNAQFSVSSVIGNVDYTIIEDPQYNGKSIQATTQANLGSAQSAGADARRVITDLPNQPTVVVEGGRFKRLKTKKIVMLRMGQSNERGSAYAVLYYTSSSIVGNGSVATLSTTIANNLIAGEKYIGTLSGAAPSSFNVTAEFTVVGTYPNCQLTFASSHVGAATTQGTLTLDVVKSYPKAFKSERFPSKSWPVWPAKTPNGSVDLQIVDIISNEVFCDVIPVNACIGSLSFIKHMAGQIDYWNANSSSYINARDPIGGGDMGDVGSLTVQNNCLFQCTSGGAMRYAVYGGSKPIPNTTIKELDYVKQVGGGASGATAPTWANAATVGSTIADGALTWTCIAINVSGNTDSSIKGLTLGTIATEGKIHFDPLGLLKRAVEAGNSVCGDADSKVCIIANGQSDTSATSAWYSSALQSISMYLVNRGWIVGVGMTCFNPASTVSAYDTILKAGHENAVATLANFTPNAIAGPDLYAGLGSTVGSNGLYLQSDNIHINENIHLSATGMIAAAAIYAEWLKQKIIDGII